MDLNSSKHVVVLPFCTVFYLQGKLIFKYLVAHELHRVRRVDFINVYKYKEKESDPYSQARF